MKCVESRVIQAYIDGELELSRKKEFQKHLEECEKCHREYIILKKTDDMVFDKLSAYKQFYEENNTVTSKNKEQRQERMMQGTSNPNRASKHQNVQDQEPGYKAAKQNKNVKNTGFIFKYRKAFTAASVAAMLTICVTVQPVRAFISDALSIFRVENVKSFQISYADIEEIQRKLEEKAGDIELENFGKIMMKGFAEQRLTVDEAKAANAPAILLPPDAKDDNMELILSQPGAITFTMDVKNVNEALKSFGSEKLFPDSLDGKTFTAHFAAQIQFTYNEGGNFFFVEQTKSPELAVPSGVDVDQMYECLAELPILPEDIRRQLQSVKDWKNTIYLPVTSRPQEVEINQAKGFIAEKDNGGWALVWYDQGNLFCIDSNAGKDEIIHFAESLR